MYINDINIFYYVLFGIIGFIIGQFIDWCSVRLGEYKNVISKNMFKIYFKEVKSSYILMIINSLIYIALLYTYGLTDLRTYIYALLVPMLICVIIIDYKKQIIPNRLTLTIFELGLVFAFLQSISNLNMAIDCLLGMIIGVSIFLIISFIGGILSGKEAMGFGDIKLIAGLGLFFGWRSIIILSVFSFFIAAIYSIILLILRKKSKNEYIPFGPFIVISSFIIIFVPFEIILSSIVSIV